VRKAGGSTLQEAGGDRGSKPLEKKNYHRRPQQELRKGRFCKGGEIAGTLAHKGEKKNSRGTVSVDRLKITH